MESATLYAYDKDSGMEYWHTGDIRRQCHDGVGLITAHHQTREEFLAMCERRGLDPTPLFKFD